MPSKAAQIWNRKLHRWGALLSAPVVLVVVATGLLLQVKKQSAWIQPPTRKGTAGAPTISFARVLEVARGVPQAGVRSWADVERLDVRPGKGVIKLRAHSRWELQLDATTGEVLQVAYRRSDLIESLHDGSFFGDPVKLGLFLPAAALLLGLWGTGVYLWLLPHLARRQRRRRAA